MHYENEVDVTTAQEWLKSGEAVMIDVREKLEHDKLSVPNIPLLPLTYFDLYELEKQVPHFKDKKLIVMCQTGRRSAMLCHELADEDIDCWNLKGGITQWVKNELPVEKDAA